MKHLLIAIALVGCGSKSPQPSSPTPAANAAADPISPKTRATIEDWFAKRATGVPPLPDKVTDLEGKPITKDEFAKQFFGADNRLFRKDPWEKLDFVENRGGADVVRVSTGIPDQATCTAEDEGCEGFESITFVVADGVIIALECFAAG